MSKSFSGKMAQSMNPVHQNLVRQLTSMLEDDGWYIDEIISEGEIPKEADGDVPDVIARRRGHSEILHAYAEVATCEEICSENTISQIDGLSKRMMKNSGQPIPLYFAVPAERAENLQ